MMVVRAESHLGAPSSNRALLGDKWCSGQYAHRLSMKGPYNP